MKTLIKQVHYPKIAIDNSESDIIQLWQNGKEDVNVIQIERGNINELISIITPDDAPPKLHLSNITDEDALKIANIYEDGIVPEWEAERKIEFGKKVASCIAGKISNLPVYNLNQFTQVVLFLQPKYDIPNTK